MNDAGSAAFFQAIMGLILSIETSTRNCSVALALNGNILSQKSDSSGFEHAEKLNIFIAEIMNTAGKDLHQLDAVAVSSGPGSYTGLRIGVSSAKGFCFALDKPLIAVPTLDAMAYGMQLSGEAEIYCPVTDARRMEVYSAVYNTDLKQLTPVSAVIVGADFPGGYHDRQIMIAGDGAEKCREFFKDNDSVIIKNDFLPEASFISALAEKKYHAGEFANTALMEPFYLKEFQPGPPKSSSWK